MTEYGRIHTDGSRSGGQPTQSDADVLEEMRFTYETVCSEGYNDTDYTEDLDFEIEARGWEAAFAVAVAKLRHPTQSDAVLDAEGVKLYWYRQGKDDGVEQERAKIVAWLRKEAIMSTDTVRRRMNKALDQIEAGEHLK